MKITVVRVPGGSKQKPCFRIYADGELYTEVTINGRSDVTSAFERVKNLCKTDFGVALHLFGRNEEEGWLVWTSDSKPTAEPVSKPASEESKTPTTQDELVTA
jgi:hypothetical protein